MTRVTYKGPGTHYLVLLKEPSMHFVVSKNDEIEIPDEVYAALKQQGDIAEGKLRDVEPEQATEKDNRAQRFR